jgi:hypothetical protein
LPALLEAAYAKLLERHGFERIENGQLVDSYARFPARPPRPCPGRSPHSLEQQAADLHPPWPLEQLLNALTTAGVPRFAETIRSVS